MYSINATTGELNLFGTVACGAPESRARGRLSPTRIVLAFRTRGDGIPAPVCRAATEQNGPWLTTSWKNRQFGSVSTRKEACALTAAKPSRAPCQKCTPNTVRQGNP